MARRGRFFSHEQEEMQMMAEEVSTGELVHPGWARLVRGVLPQLQTLRRGGRAYGREIRERVMQRHWNGESDARIARELMINRQTVRHYVQTFNKIRNGEVGQRRGVLGELLIDIRDEEEEEKELTIPASLPRGGLRVELVKIGRDHRLMLVQVALAKPELTLVELGRYLHGLDPTFPTPSTKESPSPPGVPSVHPNTYSKVLRSCGLTRKRLRLTDPSKWRGALRREEFITFRRQQREDARRPLFDGKQDDTSAMAVLRVEQTKPVLHADNLLFIDETNVPMALRQYASKGWAFEGGERYKEVTKGHTERVNVAVCAGLLFPPHDDYTHDTAQHVGTEETAERVARRRAAYERAGSFGADFGLSVGTPARADDLPRFLQGVQGKALPPFPEQLGEALVGTRLVAWVTQPPRRAQATLGLLYVAAEEGSAPRELRFAQGADEAGTRQAVQLGEEVAMMNFLYINGVEDRVVDELGELQQPNERAPTDELKRRSLQLLDRREWRGLPRRFMRAQRRSMGGPLEDFLGDSYHFVRFVDFVSSCVHAFFGADVLDDVRFGWDNASTHGRVDVDTPAASGMHNHVREVFGVSGAIFIPPNTPATDPVESVINGMKATLSLLPLPPLGRFTPAQMVPRIRYALSTLPTSSIYSWFRGSGYGFRSATTQRVRMAEPPTAPPADPEMEVLEQRVAVARLRLDRAFADVLTRREAASEQQRAAARRDDDDALVEASMRRRRLDEELRRDTSSLNRLQQDAVLAVRSLIDQMRRVPRLVPFALSFRQLRHTDSYTTADEGLLLLKGVTAAARTVRDGGASSPPICVDSDGRIVRRAHLLGGAGPPGAGAREYGWHYLQPPSAQMAVYLRSHQAHELITAACAALMGGDSGGDWWRPPAGEGPLAAHLRRLFGAWVRELAPKLLGRSPPTELLRRPLRSALAYGRRLVLIHLDDHSVHAIPRVEGEGQVDAGPSDDYTVWVQARRQIKQIAQADGARVEDERRRCAVRLRVRLPDDEVAVVRNETRPSLRASLLSLLLRACAHLEGAAHPQVDLTRLVPYVETSEVRRIELVEGEPNEGGRRRWPGYPRVTYSENLRRLRDCLFFVEERTKNTAAQSLVSLDRPWLFLRWQVGGRDWEPLRGLSLVDGKRKAVPARVDAWDTWDAQLADRMGAPWEPAERGAERHVFVPVVLLCTRREARSLQANTAAGGPAQALTGLLPTDRRNSPYRWLLQELQLEGGEVRSGLEAEMQKLLDDADGDGEDWLTASIHMRRDTTLSFYFYTIDAHDLHLPSGNEPLARALRAGMPFRTAMKGVLPVDKTHPMDYTSCDALSTLAPADVLPLVQGYYEQRVIEAVHEGSISATRGTTLLRAIRAATSPDGAHAAIGADDGIEPLSAAELNGMFVLRARSDENGATPRFLVFEDDQVFTQSRSARQLLELGKLRAAEAAGVSLATPPPTTTTRHRPAGEESTRRQARQRRPQGYLLAESEKKKVVDLRTGLFSGTNRTVPHDMPLKIFVTAPRRKLLGTVPMAQWPNLIPFPLGQSGWARADNHETLEGALAAAATSNDVVSTAAVPYVVLRGEVLLQPDDATLPSADEEVYVVKHRRLPTPAGIRVVYSPLFFVRWTNDRPSLSWTATEAELARVTTSTPPPLRRRG